MGILLLLLFLAGVLRFARLDTPDQLIFDELYYAKDACLYAGLGEGRCETPRATEQSWVHPPLGKWIIATGILLYGYSPMGYRAMAAVFGTLLVFLVYVLARKLFRDRWVAGAAAFLVATDFLLIVQSRVAMLDIFVAFFAVLGFVFLAFDRERMLLLREHARAGASGKAPAREPEWRALAGAAFGMGLAVKWSGIWALLAGLALASAWSFRVARLRYRASEDLEEHRSYVLREIFSTELAFLILPALVYLLAYLHWFASNGFAFAEFGKLQASMYDFHAGLQAEHTYSSRALTWPLILRPVAYFYEAKPDPAHVMAVANPGTWWAALGAGIWLVFRTLRRWRPEGFVAAAWFTQYAAWVITTDPAIASRFRQILIAGYLLAVVPITIWLFRRSLRTNIDWSPRQVAVIAGYLFAALIGLPILLLMAPERLAGGRSAIFLFYMTPIVPFMMIALAAALGAIRDLGTSSQVADIARAWRAAPVLYLALIAASLIFFYPVLAGLPLPSEDWMNRMIFQSWI